MEEVDDEGYIPVARTGEEFITMRSGITVEFSSQGRQKYKAPGQVYITTHRIIFIAKKTVNVEGLDAYGLDIPLVLLSNESFNQPILGANNLSGLVQPDSTVHDARSFSDVGKWKLIFKDGGAGRFLHVFMMLMERLRSLAASMLEEKDAKEVRAAAQAYVDPNDPTVVYVQQPGGNRRRSALI